MGRPKGLPKSGGRQKGAPNKRSQEFLGILSKYAYNPLEAMLQKYSTLSVEEQLRLDLKLLEFTYPKIKEVAEATIQGSQDTISDLTDDQIKERNKLYLSILKP